MKFPEALRAAMNERDRLAGKPTVEEQKDVEHLQDLFASVRVPTLCKSCGTNLDYHQCFCNSTVTQPIESDTVATTHTCELGEHCRCKSYDVAYQQDCWNWVGVVK